MIPKLATATGNRCSRLSQKVFDFGFGRNAGALLLPPRPQPGLHPALTLGPGLLGPRAEHIRVQAARRRRLSGPRDAHV